MKYAGHALDSAGQAILIAENSGKRLGGLGSVPNPAGRAPSAPPGPLSGGEGVAAHSARTPPPALGLLSVLAPQ